MTFTNCITFLLTLLLLAGCAQKQTTGNTAAVTVQTAAGPLELPAPFSTKSAVKFSKLVGWPAGQKPTAPAGFVVEDYAHDFINPRWVYVGPGGDVFVSEANTEQKGIGKVVGKVTGMAGAQRFDQSANRITRLRDTNQDGKPDQRTVFLTGLNQPFGMLILGDYFYVANTDAVLRFPYQTGQTTLGNARPDTIYRTPPRGYNNHWTRNLLASPDGKKIYLSVGSGSNVGENGMDVEKNRAVILEMNPDGTGVRTYADGLRNPVGMAWQPTPTGTKPVLYAAVNERDELGDGLVPDYLTSVREGGFYGWPYSYYGQNEDPRRVGERPDLVKKAIVPDVPLGAHTASLGLAFYDKSRFPAQYRGGAFVAQHGSWNRTELAGYKVVFVPFVNGKPGPPTDFLTGFVANSPAREVYGRPVGTFVLPDGSLLVTDDSGNRIWRVVAR